MTNPRPYDAVLCDFDGVIRFHDQSELTALERAMGLAEGTTAKVVFAPEVDRPALLGQITVEQWTEAAEAALALQVPLEQARALVTAFVKAPARADEDVLGLLRRAQAHVPVVLVTNATLDLEDDLAWLGLSHFADEVVSSARVGVAKPDPRIYEIAAERAGVPLGRCLFVDDRAENVEAARALGMTAVLFTGLPDLETALAPLLG
ncbi:HAD family hydrolase [Microbispora hainanensis]|uniref:HAD family hydrolase n=1 Tax=Microbispora hainanensis TaxID=568844 RepID=UPI001ABF6DB4|nr:HAD family phosphatase [Microbispora hainanensis]